MMLRSLVLTIFLMAGSVFAQSEAENGAVLKRALEAADRGNWGEATRLVRRIPEPAAEVLIEWKRLRDGEGTLEEYVRFLEEHSDWPGLALLHKRGEAKIPQFYRASSVKAYFEKRPPQSGTGALRLAEALSSEGEVTKAQDVIRTAWTEFNLTREEERAIAGAYPEIAKSNARTRLNNLLWRGQLTQADRMMSRVDSGYQKLASARAALQRQSPGVDARIAAVPDQWADHPGLAHDRFMWRIRKGRWDEAETFITDYATSGAELGRPEAWSNRRRGFARRAMRNERYEAAYEIARNHGLSSGSHYADLEWIAGYVALTKLNRPSVAISHFQRFDAAVKSPISKARGGYWLGRAYEALGSNQSAEEAYKAAAAHQTAYYGQLAAERIGAEPDLSLAGQQGPSQDWRKADFIDRPVVRAGMLLSHAGERQEMRRFYAHLAETLSPEEIAQLAELALDFNEPFVALGIAKQAALRGIVLPRSYFPVTELSTASGLLPPEVAMSIARRESELRVDAESPAGALGLMQLMPGTAREVSRDLGVAYSQAKLTADWRYNASLGTRYLADMLARYDGSLVLAFVAYNAGPNRANSWIEEYGDPRDPSIDAVDWVENIPFRETRNYVMRVMESLHVYRARLSGKAQMIQISQDLKEGLGAF
ncbi:MAG: lytic transglycosylase domain-containing protein [Pseudomonadota bacterium]